MADIGAELLGKIRAEFQNSCKADKYIQSVLKKIEGGTAKMEEVALLSKQLGFRVSQAIGTHVNVAALPDGKMYYNIADTILTGVLKDNYDVINSAAAECQKALDSQAGINITPQQAAFPTERVQAVVNAASVPDIAEDKMIRRMTAPAQNITESFYNDYVQTNVKFRSDAGLDCYIIRNDHGGCCEWCAKLAGKYHYPDDVPKDVYRRHDNCGCTVTYLNGKKAQNVWDKTKWNVSDDEIERMKKAGAREPVRLVDKPGKSGIMKRVEETNNYDELERYLSSKYNITTDDSVKQLDFKTVRETLKGIESVFDDFPELSDNIKKIGTGKHGVMCCSGEEIKFNPKYYKDVSGFKKMCENSSAQGWWPPNSSPASIGVHETGHAVEWLLLSKSNFDDPWQKIYAWNRGDMSGGIVSKAVKNIKKISYGKGKKQSELMSAVSRYGATKKQECFAEAFADCFSNGESANPLSQEIVKLAKEKYISLKGT